MYIEVFLIDNFLYNYLILKLSSVICSRKIKSLSLFIFSFLGAFYALFAFLFPIFMSWWAKVLFGFVLGFAFQFNGIKPYVASVSSLFLSAFIVGGLSLAVVFFLNTDTNTKFLSAPLPVRFALIAFFVASYLPRLVRKILSRRKSGRINLKFKYLGKEYNVDGIIDSGNFLSDPLTALPVILVHIPYLDIDNGIPLPITTASGDSIVIAFKPESLECNGVAKDALLALSQEPFADTNALVPMSLVPNF